MIQLIENAQGFSSGLAIKSEGSAYSYAELLDRSHQIASSLLQGRSDLAEARIAFIVDPGFEYVAMQWGIWRAGGIAVPLCVKHPYLSIKYVIEDTGAEAIIYSEDFRDLIEPLFSDFNIRSLPLDTISLVKSVLPDIAPQRRAMILYTSGTTGNPKG
ncbi:MAG: AMP-binding protein, partial [Saprospiraceae bacterium]|nr:AMP-binding protein [Saprospiraceae bacterium]